MMFHVEPISDREEIERVLHDPYISDRMSRDSHTLAYSEHPGVIYLDARGDGVFILVRSMDTEMEAHAALYEDSATRSRQHVINMVNWVFSNTDVIRIKAPITARLMSVINLCKKIGFVEEGVLRKQERKGGKLYDVHIMTMMREDW